MVQNSPLTAVPTLREQNRLRRYTAYLEAALAIAFDEGLDALTMARLAAETGAAVGTIYTYFPSKGALVAEVQREAIERLGAAARARNEGLADPLARVVGFGRFWLDATTSHPQEMRLLHLLLVDHTQAVPDDEGARVVPSAFRFLSLAAEAIEAAVAANSLTAGDDALARTVAMGACLIGCQQLAPLAHWDDELLGDQRIGRLALDALLLGWGADPTHLAAAHAAIDHQEA